MQVDIVKTMHKRQHITLLIPDKIVKRDTSVRVKLLTVRKPTSSGSEFHTLTIHSEKVISNTHA